MAPLSEASFSSQDGLWFQSKWFQNECLLTGCSQINGNLTVAESVQLHFF